MSNRQVVPNDDDTNPADACEVDMQSTQVDSHPMTPRSGGSPKAKLLTLIVVAVAVLATVALVLALVVFKDDSDDSSNSSNSDAAALASMRVGLVPAASDSSRRSSSGLRRAVNDVGTEYHTYNTPVETQIPGSGSLSTANLLLCLVEAAGIYVVQSDAYVKQVDLTPCDSTQPSGAPNLLNVTVYNQKRTPTGSGDASAALYKGNLWFDFNCLDPERLDCGADHAKAMRVQVEITIYSYRVAAECPGIPLNSDTDGSPNNPYKCWTGFVKYYEPGSFEGFMEGGYTPQNLQTLEVYEGTKDIKGNSLPRKSVITHTTAAGDVRAKVQEKLKDGTQSFHCINSNSATDITWVGESGTDAEAACLSVGGGDSHCLSRGTIDKYPCSFRAFDSNGAQIPIPILDYLTCNVTMTNQSDANGGSSFNGDDVELKLSGSKPSRTTGLDLSTAQVGTKTYAVLSPQIANDANCVSSDGTTYHLKSTLTKIIPQPVASESCAGYDNMTFPGAALPKATQTPDNENTVLQ